MSEIDEILERHQTTCSYEEDARYVYPEILKEVREALAAKEAELSQAQEEIDLLKSLIDGAKDLVELFETVTPAQRKWKDNWLRKAWEALK